MRGGQEVKVFDENNDDRLERLQLDSRDVVELVHDLRQRLDVVRQMFQHVASLQTVFGVVRIFRALHDEVEAFAEVFRVQQELAGGGHGAESSYCDADLMRL